MSEDMKMSKKTSMSEDVNPLLCIGIRIYLVAPILLGVIWCVVLFMYRDTLTFELPKILYLPMFIR